VVRPALRFKRPDPRDLIGKQLAPRHQQPKRPLEPHQTPPPTTRRSSLPHRAAELERRGDYTLSQIQQQLRSLQVFSFNPRNSNINTTTRAKHLHDVRGTFCTTLITLAKPSNQEAAEIMGWSPEQVAGIRRSYVDQRGVIMAIAGRLRDNLQTGL